MANLHGWKLTAAKVETLPSGRHIDAHGLMLVVQRSGSRSWIQRITIQGVRRDMGLGGFPMVTLQEARDMAIENRRIARCGGDPRQSQSTAPTFAEAARIGHGIQAPTISNERYRRQWIAQIEQYAFPFLGSLAVDAITMQACYAVIEPIWLTKPKTARELRQRIERVFDWVKVQGYRADNPANSGLQGSITAAKRRSEAYGVHAVSGGTRGDSGYPRNGRTGHGSARNRIPDSDRRPA